MPPSWFLRFWIGRAVRGGISRGLRVWRQLREIPGGYCGGQWPQPVRRGQPWPNGAYPRAEGLPDQRWFRGGEDLKQSLGDEPELDVSMIGRDLSPNGVAVFIRFVVQVLVAAHAPQWRHGRHPEVIGIRADDAKGLLERHFDLASQAIDADDVQGGQGQVRAHQQDGAALRMEYHDEADEDADGAPQ